MNPGTKKRKALTYGRSGRAQKARKRTPSPHVDEGAGNDSPSSHRTPSPHVDEGAENDSPLFHKTPTTKRMPSHSSLIKEEIMMYAPDMETQIAAEARGVTRKNIPWDTFRSIYLCDFSVKAQSELTVTSVRGIGEGDWEEQQFWDRLRQSLSDEVRSSGCAFIRLSVLLTY
jgi:hypothetical protein